MMAVTGARRAPRRRTRSLRLVIGAILVFQGLVWTAAAATTATPAAADPSSNATTTTLTQSTNVVAYGAEGVDTFGVTVTGQGADPPTGTVTVSDTGSATTLCTGTLAAASAQSATATCNLTDQQFPDPTSFTSVVATYGGDTNNAGSASTPGQSLSVADPSVSSLPPAPAGFETTAVNIYQSEVSTATALGQGANLESVAQYQSQLTPDALAVLYHITQQVPEWVQIPDLMQTIAGGVPATGVTSSAVRPVAGGSTSPVTAVLASFRTSLRSKTHGHAAAVLTGAPVAPFQQAACPVDPPDAVIFAAQIVIDVLTALFNASVVFAMGEVLGFSVQEEAIVVAAVTAVALGVAQVIHDVLVYLQGLANDCANANLAGQASNVDNTTVATYALLTSLAGAVVTLQTTENTTQQDVLDAQTGLSTLQTTITQALASDTQTLQLTIGSDTQSSASELQTIQTALQNDLTSIESMETAVGVKESHESDLDTTNDQTSLSTDTTEILNDTDSDAQSLTTLITQDNQQVLNLILAQGSTAQTQYNELLRLQIEQALAGWGPVVPEVKFMLPASQGGFLNSTPVGVQSVVTSDLQSMISIGATVKSAAALDLSAANTALAAGRYTAAWADYAGAYQALA
ncbi:MAG: hypothetical protein ACRDY1_07875 [Acidimicrobiales bacterium]